MDKDKEILKPQSRLTFNDVELEVYHINGERWVAGYQLDTPWDIPIPSPWKIKMSETMQILKPEKAVLFDLWEMDVYHVNGACWLRGSEIAYTLGISGGTLRRRFKAHRQEFSSDMTEIFTVWTAGAPHQTRVFNPRGVALLAMLSRGPKAAQFRRMLLNVIVEGEAPPLMASWLGAEQGNVVKFRRRSRGVH